MKTWATSRVGQATIGAILVGGISVILIILPSLHLGLLSGSPSTSQATTQAQSTANTDSNGDPNAPTSGGGGGGAPRATATPVGAPTATRTPSNQIGQQAHIQGPIQSVDSTGTSFTLLDTGTGTLCTVNTNQSTTWEGGVHAQTGHSAEVLGVWQSAATVLASSVHVEA